MKFSEDGTLIEDIRRLRYADVRHRIAVKRADTRRRKALARDMAYVARLDVFRRRKSGAAVRWFGRWLRAEMAERSMSARELADYVPHDHSVISRILRGADPRLSTLADLAGAFGYDLELVKVA